MAELGQAYISIVPSSRGLGSSIADELNGAAGPASQSFGNSFVGKLKSFAGWATVAKIAVDAFKQGAALEQSIGGVETLYGKSADIIKNYAKDAWKTAGIDANSYMEQSTSFAAALVSSLGGNTRAAAEAANTAIVDMADNANKMGTSLDLIQNAYQGFAKQNYTMLDNLKLGYGGTKTEMERLLADASELAGKEYNINNLSDVYEAIHVIQQELGITGTTSEEAASTLSGSFASMKAAAQDFLGNLVIGEDMSASMATLAESACTFFFNNLVPALGRVLQGLPNVVLSLLSTVIPNLAAKVTELLNSFSEGDGLSESGKKMVTSFAKGLIKALPQLLLAGAKLSLAFMKFTLKLPGKMLSAGISAIKGFIKGLKKMKLPKMKITWSTKSKKGSNGKAISIPLPKISWNAKGGIFDRPTVMQGLGEAGPEAVIPLNQLWNKFDNMAGQIASGVQTALMMQANDDKNIHLTLELGGSKVAEKVYKLNKQGEAALVGV